MAQEEKTTIKEEVLHWVDGLYTEQVVFTDDLKQEIYDEVDNIPEVPEELLKDISRVLNMIPNQKNVGRNGESSYDVASKLDAYMKQHNIK